MVKKPRAKPAPPPGEDPRFLPIVRSYASEPGVTYGKLFSSFGLRVRGKIFAMVVRGRLVVKLPRERVDALVASGVARRFEPGAGRLMKEWADMSGEKPSWASMVREAFRYVGRTGR
jgi:TfoX/Sxy family transcriptional regulator of competence genes